MINERAASRIDSFPSRRSAASSLALKNASERVQTV
jgi:hypothetical protein